MDAWSILKTFLLLIFILGMMYGMVYYVKKYFYTSDKKSSKYIKIKVLSTHLLMPKKYIQIVQVNDKVMVLGISEHSINLLNEMDGLIPVTDDRVNEIDVKDNLIQVLKRNLGIK